MKEKTFVSFSFIFITTFVAFFIRIVFFSFGLDSPFVNHISIIILVFPRISNNNNNHNNNSHPPPHSQLRSFVCYTPSNCVVFWLCSIFFPQSRHLSAEETPIHFESLNRLHSLNGTSHYQIQPRHSVSSSLATHSPPSQYSFKLASI